MTRPATSSRFGKMTEVIKLECELKLKEDLTDLAFTEGKPLAEFCRDELRKIAYGKLGVLRMQAKDQKSGRE